jgi:hypothetical protein
MQPTVGQTFAVLTFTGIVEAVSSSGVLIGFARVSKSGFTRTGVGHLHIQFPCLGPWRVTVTGSVADASDGLPTMVHYQVVDEYGQVQPSGTASVGSQGNYSFVVNLQASRTRQDKDGRLYTIIVTAVHQVGNTGSARTFVIVPHDQGHPVSIPNGNAPTSPVPLPASAGSSHHGGNKHASEGSHNLSPSPVVVPVAVPVSVPSNQNVNGNGHRNHDSHGNGNGNYNSHGDGHGNAGEQEGND